MELLYHYLWKYKMMGRPLTTTDGAPIIILFPGVHNENAGPDFSDARLKIDNQTWVGNVEIHIKASDWFRHGHQSDPAYDSVILHVVGVNDAKVERMNGELIPQCQVVLPEGFYMTYSRLHAELKGIRCSGMLPVIPRLQREDWLETLSMERLHFKAQRILDYYTSMNSDWEQAGFTTFARALGFGLNGVPFEILAKNLPLKYVWHHADNLLQVEALLFGQAGMLDSSQHIFDEYYQKLCVEYAFMARKYGLRPMRADLWKYARTRPGNFPHRRIALLAKALHEGVRFTNSLLEAEGDIDKLLSLFSWRLSGYWLEHAGFGSDVSRASGGGELSHASKELLLINVAAPFYYAYANITGNFDLAEYGYDILRHLNAERNTIISSWMAAGLKADDALRSQALIHLSTEYCNRGRCLECRFGHYLLRAEAQPHEG